MVSLSGENFLVFHSRPSAHEPRRITVFLLYLSSLHLLALSHYYFSSSFYQPVLTTSTTVMSTPTPISYIPSYASSTVSSRQRQHTSLQTKAEPASPAPILTRTIGRRDLKHYVLSTQSSRAKAVALPKFNFFALPPELRNQIYEYTDLRRHPRWLNLRARRASPNLSDYTDLPALLRTRNSRLFHEAGSYYFGSGRFDIVIREYHCDILLRFLRLIGPGSRQLASNSDVHVHVLPAWPTGDFFYGEYSWPPTRLTKYILMHPKLSALARWTFSYADP